MSNNNQPPYPRTSLEQRADELMTLVRTLQPSLRNNVSLDRVLALAQDLPEEFLPKGFAKEVSQTFSVNEDVIKHSLNGHAAALAGPFDDLVPRSGWLCDYIEYTKTTEPPTVFHFFSALCVLGATIARRRHFPMGSGDVFPNLSVVLVAPPGACKKTTACNMAVNLFRRIGGNLLADKMTPEAIIESFKTSPNATGLIYAPEWSVFIGKQQYLDGLVPLLTALFDCPEIWTSTTIMRGTVTLSNVAISHLAATTIDWLQTSSSKDAVAGGFTSRMLFVVQKETPRLFALPPPLDLVLRKRLVDYMVSVQHTVGIFSLSPEATHWYETWYKNRSTTIVDKHFAGYYERKHVRLLQIAMLLACAENPKDLVMRPSHLMLAERILLWIERFLPSVFEELSQSMIGDDQARLLKQIRKHGQLNYSEWLRMNTRRMNSVSFKQYLATMMQAKMITVDPTTSRYYLLRAGRAMDI